MFDTNNALALCLVAPVLENTVSFMSIGSAVIVTVSIPEYSTPGHPSTSEAILSQIGIIEMVGYTAGAAP